MGVLLLLLVSADTIYEIKVLSHFQASCAVCPLIFPPYSTVTLMEHVANILPGLSKKIKKSLITHDTDFMQHHIIRKATYIHPFHKLFFHINDSVANKHARVF